MGNTKNAETIILCDADDFAESNSGLDILRRIKGKNKDFKISLFTIPGLCSHEWIAEINKLDWIEMIPHGLVHTTPRECEKWTYDESMTYLDVIEPLGLEKGFKAPGWQISDGMYKALLERGYWVADQHYNDKRRPKGLEVKYPGEHHYHIGHLGGHNENAIEYFEERLSNLKGEFKLL